MTRPLLRSAAFVRASRRVVRRQPQVLDAIGGTLRPLESDAFDPRLRTHKLRGDLAGCWACSAGYDADRVRVRPTSGFRNLLLLSVGTHDEVY